jgi:nicotinate phosphoribosyltransferase
MEHGRIAYRLPALEEIKETTLKNLSELPEEYKRLRNPSLYPVELSRRLTEIKNIVVNRLRS